MTNILVIDWHKLDTFTAVPEQISSICKYHNKKLSMDHKVIYSYLAKLDADGKLNSNGFASFDNMMKRFGYGSKGSLTGYINHLIEVGLLSKCETKKGQRNIYTVHPIDQYKVSYGSKSHTADSNKNKLADQKDAAASTNTKVNNYPIALKYRRLFADNAQKLKEFNRLAYRADREGLRLDPSLIAKHMIEWEKQSNPLYAEELFDGTESFFSDNLPISAYEDIQEETCDYDDSNLSFGFVSDINLEGCPVYTMCANELTSFEQYCVGDEEDYNCGFVSDINLDDCPSNVHGNIPKQATSDKSKLESHLDLNVVDDIPPSFGLGWFAKPLGNNSLDKSDTVKYLSILHKRNLWQDYNPNSETISDLISTLESNEQSLELFEDSIFSDLY